MKFSILFPHLRNWVTHLDKYPPGNFVKPNFAYWEVLHILSIVILGGTAILIGLRLIGFGLTEEKPSDVYKNLKAWLHTGVIGVIVTGILIGTANAERLYDSPAFLVKMLSLLSGIILTYGAMRPIALADGAVSRSATAGAILGLLVWALGLWVFLTGGLLTPGLFHVMSAAALIVLFVTQGRLRWIYTAGVSVMLIALWAATHVFIKEGDIKTSDSVNLVLSVILALWISGAAVAQVFANRGKPGDSALTAKVVGYAVILVWVCGAAAGRWIAFG